MTMKTNSRLHLLEEYMLLQCRIKNCNSSLLIGMEISLPVYGAGIITHQTKLKTCVHFNNGDKIFEVAKPGEYFTEDLDIHALHDEMERVKRRLDAMPTPYELIKKLVENWQYWEDYEDYYLKEVAPQLVLAINWGSSDAPILKPLKEMLSEEDWANLSAYIADVHFGRIPKFIHDDTFIDEEELAKKIEEKYIKENYNKTCAIINRIIEREKAEEQRLKVIAQQEKLRAQIKSRINELFRQDFFAAESYYQANKADSLLSADEFNKMKLRHVAAWFAAQSTKLPIIPDAEQLDAICAGQKNIEVVARAGSGKTATIVNRFHFLTEHCSVDASSMLLLAFNKKAAQELHDKIEKLISHKGPDAKMPHIMTFHALAYSIVHPEETLIYDDEEASARMLSSTVQRIIDKKIRDVIWAAKIREVMLSHFKGNWESIEKGGHNLTREEQLLYRRSIPNRTLKGEYVKSYGEKVIANILFEHDIDYSYEKAFYWFDGSIYHPDFTVKGPDNKKVIIEYFGRAGEPSYDRQIQSKRDFWDRQGTPLIEVYPSDVSGNMADFSSELLGLLYEEGVKNRKLSDNEIWERIKDRAIDEFTKAITSFIGRCRKKSLSTQNLDDLIQNYQSEQLTENLYLEIANEIYYEYIATIHRDKLEDFDGLISRACNCIQEGKTGYDKWNSRGDLKELSCIMIDEYQDFSYLFEKFLTSIRSVCPLAGIFCVGDDWQAINAFAGSDVQYFRQFLQRYDDAKMFYLRTNYRSKKEIVFAGTNLMSSGASADRIKAANQGSGCVKVASLTEFDASPGEQSIHGSDKLTPAVLRLVSKILGDGKRVVFLTRSNDRLPVNVNFNVDVSGTGQDKFLNSVRSYFAPDQRKLITASTTHKYKGKEEDVVIILDALVGFYPLIHPAWIFQRIFGDSVEKHVEEEKRLFYVAVSRAKEELIILTSKGEESPFIGKLGNIEKLKWSDYAPLRTGKERIRVEIYNQKGYGSEPTWAIKESLKSHQYQWDTPKKTWYRFYPQEDFDINDVLHQNWVYEANHVVLIRYNETERVEDAYLLADGKITKMHTKR